MFRPPLLPSSGRYYTNTDIIQTNCQTAQIQSLDVTVIISGAPYGCKMSDYVLLKKGKIYIAFKKQIKCICLYFLFSAVNINPLKLVEMCGTGGCPMS